ncbi:hypothetical protein [Streptomyces sp. URMC 124]|uniref:hypothetical protein n=1 Tax=Streptomyces sp. URMC 124 TaxID=3423405 RepID=UPI003F1DBD45
MTPPEAAPALGADVAAPPLSSCGVYVWATAHGIDLSHRGPLASCTCGRGDGPAPRAAVGAFVVDTRTDRLGRVMGHEGPRLQLRPPAGGREWEAEPAAVRPATDVELLIAKVREANAASRWGK